MVVMAGATPNSRSNVAVRAGATPGNCSDMVVVMVVVV